MTRASLLALLVAITLFTLLLAADLTISGAQAEQTLYPNSSTSSAPHNARQVAQVLRNASGAPDGPSTPTGTSTSTVTATHTSTATDTPTETGAATNTASMTVTPSSTASATASATPTTCVPRWEVPPGRLGSLGTLNAVSAWSQDDAWAVGSTVGGAEIDHWDGSTWSAAGGIPGLGGSGEFSGLSDVEAVGPGEAWAVGGYSSDADRSGIVVHCTLGVGCTASRSRAFTALSAVSPNDIWAVGREHPYGGGASAIGHYDGTSWSLVPPPDTRILHAIDARAADDVWAVGEDGLIAHWNGSEWSVVPGAPGANVNLRDIVAVGVDDAWAVGSAPDGKTAIMHWNGEAWSLVPSPSPGILGSGLSGVDAVSPNDIWAVGSSYDSYDPGNFPPYQPKVLSLHWDGVQWSNVPNPGYGSPYEGAGALYSVAAPAHDYVLAVGYRLGQNGEQISWTGELYRNPCPDMSCPVQFADLPSSGEGSTFYAYARCLSCRGIISGYACGGAGEPCNDQNQPYFRPGVNVTRGQISKMVALAAGLKGPTGDQRFQDVWPNNTFYDVIQQLASRGYIGGYPCGQNPQEPCVAPANRAYFRPSANTTRGQLSKIVSNAAVIDDPVSGQTYEDVPEESPFYLWIERLTNLNVMSGYPCGGVDEPCGASDKPYFRPNANVTRGQTAKIVSNTFFPNCQSPASR